MRTEAALVNRCLRPRMSEEDSEGSPVRFKRKTKIVDVLTSSESDSDDGIGVADTRRKRLRVKSKVSLATRVIFKNIML